MCFHSKRSWCFWKSCDVWYPWQSPRRLLYTTMMYDSVGCAAFSLLASLPVCPFIISQPAQTSLFLSHHLICLIYDFYVSQASLFGSLYELLTCKGRWSAIMAMHDMYYFFLHKNQESLFLAIYLSKTWCLSLCPIRRYLHTTWCAAFGKAITGRWIWNCQQDSGE